MLSGTEGSFIYEFTDGKYIPKPSIELSHLTQVSLLKIQLKILFKGPLRSESNNP